MAAFVRSCVMRSSLINQSIEVIFVMMLAQLLHI